MQTEICTDSGGGISGSGGHINPTGQQNHVKKDEPEDEGYVCKSKGHITAHCHLLLILVTNAMVMMALKPIPGTLCTHVHKLIQT